MLSKETKGFFFVVRFCLRVHERVKRCVICLYLSSPESNSTFMSTVALGGCVTQAVGEGEAAQLCIVSGQWEERGQTGEPLQVPRAFFTD